jgi:hypothetical protein
VGNKNCILERNGGVLTPNILARKSQENPLPYCKTGVESEGLNRSDFFVNTLRYFLKIDRSLPDILYMSWINNAATDTVFVKLSGSKAQKQNVLCNLKEACKRFKETPRYHSVLAGAYSPSEHETYDTGNKIQIQCWRKQYMCMCMCVCV